MAQEIHFNVNSKVVLAKTNSEKAKCFANVLGTTMEAKSYPEIGLSPIQTRHWDDELIVDCDELDSILKTKRNSAPGEDNITYEQIKQSTVELRTTVCALLTSCLNIGLTSETWKHSKVVMIPKANKDRKEGKNYRPISLTSCLAKLLETAAKSRLTKYCERNRFISVNQTAYRKSRCTTDNLTKLTETIAKGLKTKRHTATIFLDVEKAFDSVHHETLIQKLHDLGLNPRLTHWITDFLRGRKCTIEINECQSDAFYPRAGVPQGSVIAPQLFNIYVNGPPVAKCQISQYADDIALYYQSSNIGLAIEKLRQGLETLTNWLDKNYIKINHSKSNFLLFTNKKNSEDLTLTIRSQCLKQQNNVKFLSKTTN